MNFIQKYSEVLPDDLLENLLSLIEQNIQYNVRSNTTQQDKQLSLEPFWPDLAAQVNQSLLSATLKDYLERYPYLSRHPEWTSANTLLQKTSPSEGYHEWHCENMGWVNNSRAIAWMIYLNDVEEGGETEFLYINKRVKAKQGSLVIFPAAFTHTHRGNPPIGQEKYILTTWLISQDDRTYY